MTDVNEQLRSWVTSGLSDAEIADKLGVSARTAKRLRKAAGLPSMWRPVQAQCGSRTRYARGCRCDACKAANAQAQQRLKDTYTALTRSAPAICAPWTPEDDAYLLNGPGTLLQRAQRLGRTYEACDTRRTRLRRQEALTA